TYERKEIDPSEIITEKDITEVIEKGCRTFREKAILRILHESGLRIGEFLGMRIKDVSFKDNFVQIHVTGKTGPRTIPLVKSMNFLHKYLELHPYKNDPEAYIWISKCTRRLNLPLNHTGITKLIKNCFKRAEVKKKCNCHWIRHSRASLLAPKLTEVMMCEFMGWEKGSEISSFKRSNINHPSQASSLRNIFLCSNSINHF
ncbi:site-specific integrase, partial [Candidatus Woesearchaeota archaeon]|nr:site-specific integrase [Candidatus Woesearchaeota archaeon]